MSQTAPAQARTGYRRRRGILALLAALACLAGCTTEELKTSPSRPVVPQPQATSPSRTVTPRAGTATPSQEQLGAVFWPATVPGEWRGDSKTRWFADLPLVEVEESNRGGRDVSVEEWRFVSRSGEVIYLPPTRRDCTSRGNDFMPSCPVPAMPGRIVAATGGM